MVERRESAESLAALVKRAEALVPALRERAPMHEQLRRIPEETIADLRSAGLFRVFQPARYGGYELDYGPTQLALSGALGPACGSTAWVQSILACHAWLLGMFSEEAQDAVWGRNPDALIASSFASTTGGGRPVDGGYLVSGQWQFSSGIDAADWLILNVPLDPATRYGRFALVPRSEWEIVDTWYAAGLRGSGSQDVRIREAFVSTAHTLDPNAPGAEHPGATVNECYIYRLPVVPVFPYNVAPPAYGVARGILDTFVEQTAGRPDRVNDPAKHARIAESAAEIDAAAALLAANAAEFKRLTEAAEPFGPEHEARYRRDLAFAVQLCVRAVDRLAVALGAHGMLETNPVNRGLRDIHAIANHVGVAWDIVGPAYGRVRLGL
jgi:3-hydroxy-9,10-secoandrosta-1,3,5(10)-triene-9,17-dione monooxygenase